MPQFRQHTYRVPEDLLSERAPARAPLTEEQRAEIRERWAREHVAASRKHEFQPPPKRRKR
jgi:hypothetical protein